jgi:hypothetical protein
MDAKIQYLKSILMKSKMVEPSKEDDPELAKILDEVLGMSNALGEVGGGGDKAGKTLLHDAAGDTTMNKEWGRSSSGRMKRALICITHFDNN